MLYFKAGTHWNNKAAYLSFISLLKELNIEYPKVEFTLDTSNKGDIETPLANSKWADIKDYPQPTNENWTFSFSNSNFTKESIEFSRDEPKSATFGPKKIVINNKPITNKTIWVIGDSFITRLRPFLERTFREVHYIGHWSKKLDSISTDLVRTSEKPDLILVVKVERSF